MSDSITLGQLRDQMRSAVERIGAIAPSNSIQVFYTPTATEHDGYNWPESKNRSARVTKKLSRRFGCWERRKPCAYQMGGRLFVHPALRGTINALPQGGTQETE